MWKQICILSENSQYLKVYRFASAPFNKIRKIKIHSFKMENKVIASTFVWFRATLDIEPHQDCNINMYYGQKTKTYLSPILTLNWFPPIEVTLADIDLPSWVKDTICCKLWLNLAPVKWAKGLVGSRDNMGLMLLSERTLATTASHRLMSETVFSINHKSIRYYM